MKADDFSRWADGYFCAERLNVPFVRQEAYNACLASSLKLDTNYMGLSLFNELFDNWYHKRGYACCHLKLKTSPRREMRFFDGEIELLFLCTKGGES